ncbi:MAG TPA: 50S ribosomal protein L6 [Actinomycetota bacterium]|nr:50S ribosomal protein L6 [Actinomycetota bacterium]
MSRIGKMPIPIPQGVDVQIAPGRVVAKGPLGQLEAAFPERIECVREDDALLLKRSSDARQDRAFHGLARALVANVVRGVAEGFQKTLEIRGVGYRANLEGQDLNILVGYSHPVKVSPPPGITFEVLPGGNPQEVTGRIVVRGASKEQVGQVSANIRKIRPPEPYKGKGIRYEGEHIRRKVGKAAK